MVGWPSLGSDFIVLCGYGFVVESLSPWVWQAYGTWHEFRIAMAVVSGLRYHICNNWVMRVIWSFAKEFFSGFFI